MRIRNLRCSFRLAVGQSLEVGVSLLQSSNSANHLLELLRLHLDRVRISGEVLALAVHVEAAVQLEFCQGQLFETDADHWKPLPLLIERLSHRLGEEAVLRPRLWPDAQPEQAFRYRPWLEEVSDSSRSPVIQSQPLSSNRGALFRPPCLTQPMAIPVLSLVPGGPPLQFQWRGTCYRIPPSSGPQREENYL